MSRISHLQPTGRLVFGLAIIMLISALPNVVWAKADELHGRVFALNDKGRMVGVVPSAKIVFNNAGGAIVAQSTTDSRGRYSADVPAGQLYYTINAEGYRDEDHQRGINVMQTGGRGLYNLSMIQDDNPPSESDPPSQELVILVTVYLELDSGRKPLPDASVIVRKDGQSFSQAIHGTTDQKGQISMDLLSPGDYTAVAKIAGLPARGTKINVDYGLDNHAVIVLDRRRPPVPDPPRPELVQIHGYVKVKSSNSRSGYKAVANAELNWTATSGAKLNATSDRRGYYSLTLAKDTYLVMVNPPAGYTGTSQSVTVHDETERRDFIVGRTVISDPPRVTRRLLTVRVMAYTRPGFSVAHPTATSPVPNAHVSISQPGRRGAAGITSSHGVYSAAFPNGTYQISVRKPGYRVARGTATLRGQNVTHTIFLMRERPNAGPGGINGNGPSSYRLTVNVLERSSSNRVNLGVASSVRPIPSARVIVRLDGLQVATGYTNAQGKFFSSLPPGTYQIAVSRRGFGPRSDTAIVSNRHVSRTVYLTQSGRSNNQQLGTITPYPNLRNQLQAQPNVK